METRQQSKGRVFAIRAVVASALLTLLFVATAMAAPRATIVRVPSNASDAEFQADIKKLRSALQTRGPEWVVLPSSNPPSWLPVQEQVRAAEVLLTQFDDQGALTRLLEAEAVLAQLTIDTKNAQVLVALNLVAARACFSLRKKRCVQQRLQLVHSLTPNLVRLDTKKFPPALAARYRKAIAQQNRSEGKLDLDITPANATISVDGRPVQTVDGRVSLTAGDHYLTFQAGGYRTKTLRIPENSRSTKVQLQELSPVQRASELVRAIQENPAQRLVLQELLVLLDLDILYVIRGDGEVLYLEKGADTFVGWHPIVPTLRSPLPAPAEPGVNPLIVSSPGNSDKSWYQSRTTKIVVGLVLVASTTAVIFALSGDDEPASDVFDSGKWEWNLP